MFALVYYVATVPSWLQTALPNAALIHLAAG